MNIQFSIIMPVYNGEDYLCASINSVIHQKYENFELILVDDGSKDNSSVICKKFELEDNRVRYYYKENSGISGARNYGMNLARGKYITFIDQDDLWDSEFLSVSQNIITNKMVDTVKVSINYYVHKQNKEKKISKFIYSSDCLITRQDIRSKYYILKNNGLFTFVWNTIFLRDIIVNNNIKFCEDLKFGGEDNVFNYSYLKHSQSIYTLKKPLYSHYRRINISQSTKISKNKIKSNEIFYTSETSFIDFMKIKETPSRISDYLLGYVNIIFDISKNKQQFISEYYANLSAINSMKQRYFKHYKVKSLWKNPYKLIMINFIVKNRINKLFFILKVKKRLGQ